MSLELKRKLEGAFSGHQKAAKNKVPTNPLYQVDQSHNEPQRSNSGKSYI